MKEKKCIKQCLALLLALTMVISGMTIPEKKATAAEDTTVASEATEVNDASVEYVAQIGEQGYATFAEALDVANDSTEAVTIKLLADVELTNSIVINNANNVDITIDGTNGDARYKLAISSVQIDNKGNPSIQLHQKSGEITFQNMNIEHGGTEMLLRLGENTYGEGTDRALTVNMTNMDIISTSKYEFCLMATQALGQFNINMTDVNVDWNRDNTYTADRAFLRCGNGNNDQTVNLTTTRCTIDVSDTTQTKGMHIMSKVSGEFKLNDTDILVPVLATEIYTKSSSATATITSDGDCAFTRVYKVADDGEFKNIFIEGEKAIANASTEHVLIKLKADINLTGYITINNTNGKNITIDGKNGDNRYKLTYNNGSGHAIRVHQTTGVVTLQNLDIDHFDSNMLLRLGDDYKDGKVRNLIVNMTNMDITSTSKYTYCLTAMQALGTFNVNMTNVDVDWNGDASASEERAFLRCGNGNATGKQKLTLTATGCTINVADTKDARGMYVMKNVSATFNLQNTDIITAGVDTYKNAGNIEFNADDKCALSTNGGIPVVELNGQPYLTFKKALAIANESKTDVTIKLLADITVGVTEAKISNANDVAITIDGNNKAYTVTTDKNAFVIDSNCSVNFVNMDIAHVGTQGVLMFNTAANVSLTNVDITASYDGYQYGLISIIANVSGEEGEVVLNMNQVDVEMKVKVASNHAQAAIVRVDNRAAYEVDINIVDSKLDASSSSKVKGIYIQSGIGKAVAVDLVDTTIFTLDDAPIYDDSNKAIINTQFTNDDNKISCSTTYVAQIGTKLFENFTDSDNDATNDALSVANNSKADVTINLLSDITVGVSKGVIYNTNDVAITIAGNKNTVTTNQNAFVINSNCSVNFVDMDIAHVSSQGVLMFNTAANVSLTNVDITASYDGYQYGLISIIANVSGEEGEVVLNMNQVDVEMKVKVASNHAQAAIVRVDNRAAYEVDINIVDSKLDASSSSKVKGIYIQSGMKGDVNVDLVDTTILTKDDAPIYDGTNAAKVNKTFTEKDATKEGYTRISSTDYVAQVGNELFKNFTDSDDDAKNDALSVANAASGNTTIQLLQDISVTNDHYISNNVTIDGNNHTITTAGGKDDKLDNNAFRINKASGNVELKNLTIVHKNRGSVIQTDKAGVTLSITDTIIKATNPDNTAGTYNYTLINMAYNSTLNMTRVDVDMAVETKGAQTTPQWSIIRTGNNDKEEETYKTVTMNLVDCTLDVTKAYKRSGILILDANAIINLENTSILTQKDDECAAIQGFKNGNSIQKATISMSGNSLLKSGSSTALRDTIKGLDGDSGITDGCKCIYTKFNNVTAFKTSEGKYEVPNPVPTGYVFAGWYAEEACTAQSALNETYTETSAWAKFVPDHVMEVKAQISANLINDNNEDDGSGSIRFVTTVDSLDYNAVGFAYTIMHDGQEVLKGTTTKTGVVYRELRAVGTKNGEPLKYIPEITFCAESEYFKAITFKNISSDLFDAEITVTPFWTTLNGTKVCGEPVTKTVQQGIDGGADSEGNFVGGSESTASVYTNRLVLLADAHYMTDKPVSGKDAPSAGLTLGYTQAKKIDFIREDVNGFIDKFSGDNSVKGVLVLGDLGTDDPGFRTLSDGKNYVEKFKLEVMDAFKAKSYALPGNHDSYSNGIWREIFGYNRQYSVKIGDAAFIMLDTFAGFPAVDGGGSQYIGVDIEWLENELKQYPTERIFLCCHNYAEDKNTANDAELKRVIAGNDRIVCMFKGHSHSNGTYTPDSLAGIPLIGIGGYAYNVTSEVEKDDAGNPIKDSEGNPITTTDYNKFGASWAWGYQVLEWNEEEVHLYHVKPARTYTDSARVVHEYAGAIEDDIVIKLK